MSVSYTHLERQASYPFARHRHHTCQLVPTGRVNYPKTLTSYVPVDVYKRQAQGKDFVRIEDDKAIWQNHWIAGGKDMVWSMVHYDVQSVSYTHLLV